MIKRDQKKIRTIISEVNKNRDLEYKEVRTEDNASL